MDATPTPAGGLEIGMEDCQNDQRRGKIAQKMAKKGQKEAKKRQNCPKMGKKRQNR